MMLEMMQFLEMLKPSKINLMFAREVAYNNLLKFYCFDLK